MSWKQTQGSGGTVVGTWARSGTIGTKGGEQGQEPDEAVSHLHSHQTFPEGSQPWWKKGRPVSCFPEHAVMRTASWGQGSQLESPAHSPLPSLYHDHDSVPNYK